MHGAPSVHSRRSWWTKCCASPPRRSGRPPPTFTFWNRRRADQLRTRQRRHEGPRVSTRVRTRHRQHLAREVGHQMRARLVLETHLQIRRRHPRHRRWWLEKTTSRSNAVARGPRFVASSLSIRYRSGAIRSDSGGDGGYGSSRIRRSSQSGGGQPKPAADACYRTSRTVVFARPVADAIHDSEHSAPCLNRSTRAICFIPALLIPRSFPSSRSLWKVVCRYRCGRTAPEDQRAPRSR